MMKVKNLNVRFQGEHFTGFDVDILGVKTWCYLHWEARELTIKWHAGGTRVLTLTDYENMHSQADLLQFIEDSLFDVDKKSENR